MRLLPLAACAATLFAGSALFAQEQAATVLTAVSYGESDSLFNLTLRQPLQPGGQAAEMVQKHGPLVDDVDSAGRAAATITAPLSSPSTQTTAGRALAAVTAANFEGPGVGYAGFTMYGAPPDPTLAVSPSYIVAWVNSSFAVFNKAGVLQLPGGGFANGNTLFTGMGNVCETTNRGDPILQYDRLAQRWIMSQFAFNLDASGNIIAPALQCIAVSTSDNPMGTWFRYAIDFSSIGFNDYGKLGVWPDAYYTTYNVFSLTTGSNTGAIACASDRAAMLAGSPTATTLCIPRGSYAGGSFGFVPGDMDGTTLPTTLTQGNIIMRFSTAPALRMIKILPNFAASTITYNNGFGGANGTFVELPTGTTTRACNGLGGTCVVQPGTTTKLDTLGDRLMYRLAYRNRGGVDSLVVAQSVDPDGSGSRSSAVRWYEVRSPFSSTPTLFQNATYDPGASGDRWMGSIAMDKMGNIMLGYSVANATAGLKPSIRATGRLRSDLRNQMQAEQDVWTGTGSQTTYTRSGTTYALTRWGDYTTMQVDPADDCTFWYINQYLAADGTFNWRTRIAGFKFNGCQ
jgi:hypothetical protein